MLPTQLQVRLRNFGYYKRQRASKPEVSGVQGLACLAYVAAKRPSAGASETSRHLQGWFKRSLEHFALTWLTRNIGAALKVDACNLSDFRGRPDQMEVSYLALASLRGLLHRVLTLIKNGHLPSLPTLQRYQESLYRKAELDGTNPSVDELDTFEDLTAAVSEVSQLDNCYAFLSAISTTLAVSGASLIFYTRFLLLPSVSYNWSRCRKCSI